LSATLFKLQLDKIFAFDYHFTMHYLFTIELASILFMKIGM